MTSTYCIERASFDFHDGRGPVPAHKHSNGMGWVADTAHVDGAVYIGPEARVSGWAKVTGDARLYDYSQVCDHASVGGKALLTDHATIGGFASIDDCVELHENSYVGGGSHLHNHEILRAGTVHSDFSQCLGCPGLHYDGYGATSNNPCVDCLHNAMKRSQRNADVQQVREVFGSADK
jgi:hypothetical protein